MEAEWDEINAKLPRKKLKPGEIEGENLGSCDSLINSLTQ
jgi:hypothetical protein